MSFDDYVGRSQTTTDEVSPRLLAGLAATLGVDTPEIVPPLWHWMLFQDWVPPDRIGPDGHPKRGGFLPPVHDLPRRMWAGGRVRWHGTLGAGDRVSRISTIQRVQEKQGGAGRLVFVTVKHVIDGPSALAIEEEQDLVYRDTDGAAVKPATAVSGQRPAFHDRALVLEARPGADGAALRSLDEEGAVCMQAKAEFV